MFIVIELDGAVRRVSKITPGLEINVEDGDVVVIDVANKILHSSDYPLGISISKLPVEDIEEDDDEFEEKIPLENKEVEPFDPRDIDNILEDDNDL